MPHRRQATKGRRGALSWEQILDLLIGGSIPSSVFDSDEERRDAYFDHRDELMAECPPGSRPLAFYEFETKLKDKPRAPTDRAGHVVMTDNEAEVAWLRKHGHLTAWEERELATHRVVEGASAIEPPEGAS